MYARADGATPHPIIFFSVQKEKKTGSVQFATIDVPYYSSAAVLHTHAGRHNPEIAAELFPHKSQEDQAEFSEVKEAYFRTLAKSSAYLLSTLLYSRLRDGGQTS